MMIKTTVEDIDNTLL